MHPAYAVRLVPLPSTYINTNRHIWDFAGHTCHSVDFAVPWLVGPGVLLHRLRCSATIGLSFRSLILNCIFSYDFLASKGSYWSHVSRKPIFGIYDQVRLKPACSADETSFCLEISAVASRGIIVSRQRTTKALISLCGCAGWSAQADQRADTQDGVRLCCSQMQKQVFSWRGSFVLDVRK